MIHSLVLFLAAARPAVVLEAQMEQIARAAGGRSGASVKVIETGASASFHSRQRFPMQSVYKLPIAMAVLNGVDHGALRLQQNVRVLPADLVPKDLHSPIRDDHPAGNFDLSLGELLRLAVSESDGSASDVLLRVLGGTAPVELYLKRLGIGGIAVKTTEQEMARNASAQYRNWATPESAVALLVKLLEGAGLSPPSRKYLMQLMTQTATGPHRIKGELPRGTEVAHKTGTSNTVNGITAATNDIGVIALPNGLHLAAAVFVSDSPASTDIREAAIARIAKAAWDLYGAEPKN